jgi:hypothetical protein
MRARMSKNYINQLRGTSQLNIKRQSDINNNKNRISSPRHTKENVKSKASSLSLPQVRFQKKLTTSYQSAITLSDHSRLNSINRSILTDIISAGSEEEITTIQPPNKGNNQLTVPPVGDYCMRISNTPSVCDEEQHEGGLNDSRLSDALGYLHMYQNHNRIQFNALEFNDREDLQVAK